MVTAHTNIFLSGRDVSVLGSDKGAVRCLEISARPERRRPCADFESPCRSGFSAQSGVQLELFYHEVQDNTQSTAVPQLTCKGTC